MTSTGNEKSSSNYNTDNNYYYNNNNNSDNKVLLRRTSDEACMTSDDSDNVVANDRQSCDAVNAASISNDTFTQTVTTEVTCDTTTVSDAIVSVTNSVSATSTAKTVGMSQGVTDDRSSATVAVNSLSPVSKATADSQPSLSSNTRLTEPYPVEVIFIYHSLDLSTV